MLVVDAAVGSGVESWLDLTCPLLETTDDTQTNDRTIEYWIANFIRHAS